MAVTLFRGELWFPANPPNSSSNASRCPYLSSGNNTGRGFDSALQIAIGNAPSDVYIELPIAGDERYIHFEVDTTATNLLQGNLNLVGSGTTPGAMMGCFEITSGFEKKLFVAKQGHINLDTSTTKLEVSVWATAPRFA